MKMGLNNIEEFPSISSENSRHHDIIQTNSGIKNDFSQSTGIFFYSNEVIVNGLCLD